MTYPSHPAGPAEPAATPPPGWYPGPNAPVQWWDGGRWGPPAPPGSDNSAMLAVFCHLGGLFVSFLVPLIILLTEGKKKPLVKHHATEALNLQISLALGFLLLGLLYVIGLVLTIGGAVTAGTADAAAGAGVAFGGLFAVVAAFFVVFILIYVYALVCAIIASAKAGRGEYWRYPVSIRFVRGAAGKDEIAALNAAAGPR